MAASNAPINTAAETEILALEAALAKSASALAAKDAELVAQAKVHDQALAAARAEGHAAGLRAAVSQDAERLAHLEAGLDRALALLQGHLAGVEQLAVAVSTACLDKIFGEASAAGEAVQITLRGQLTKLDTSSVLHVRVAASDFPDAEALAQLGQALGYSGLDLRGDPRLAPGDCTIKLKLGEIEIGPGQQWRQLRSMLSAMVENAASQ
jgi:flagellar biosynthesis/type III secretory pathway protein FliH